jgi:hypothetical protein
MITIPFINEPSIPFDDGFTAAVYTRLHAICHCDNGTSNVALLQFAPRALNEST